MLRATTRSTHIPIRLLTTSNRVTFQQKNSILDKYKADQETIEAPSKLAAESHLPFIKQNLYKRNPVSRNPRLHSYQNMKTRMLSYLVGKKKLVNLLFLPLVLIWTNQEVGQLPVVCILLNVKTSFSLS